MFEMYDQTLKKVKIEDKSLDYGENCKQPDMKEDDFNAQVEVFKAQLMTWQAERNDICLRTAISIRADEALFKSKKLIDFRFFGPIAKRQAQSKVFPFINSILYKNYSYDTEVITKRHYKKMILQDFVRIGLILCRK